MLGITIDSFLSVLAGRGNAESGDGSSLEPETTQEPDAPTGGTFLVSGSPQAQPVNLFASSGFASGDEAPSGANGGSWQGTTEGIVEDGVIKAPSGGINTRFDITKIAGKRLTPGNLYVAAVDVPALTPTRSGKRITPKFQGPLYRFGDEYANSGSGMSSRGVHAFAFGNTGDHTHIRWEVANGLSATLDNFRLYDLTERLARPIDLYIIFGQSNSVGNENGTEDYSGLTVDEANFDPRVLYIPGSVQSGNNARSVTEPGKLQVLCNPLQHQGQCEGIGPGASFLSKIADETPEDRLVVGLCAGKGGSALVQDDGEWNRKGNNPALWNGLNKLIDDFLAEYPQARVRGALWCQGEADSGPAGASSYKAKFETDLAGPLRAKYGDFPIVLLSVRDDFSGFPNIDPAHRAIAADDPLTAYVKGITDADGDGEREVVASDLPADAFGEPTHFTREQQRRNGIACFEAIKPLLNAAYG